MTEVQNVKWVHEIKLTSEIFWPAQANTVSRDIRVMIQRSWVQSQLGAIFDEIYFALPCVKDLSDNLTEKRIVKNPNKVIQSRVYSLRVKV